MAHGSTSTHHAWHAPLLLVLSGLLAGCGSSSGAPITTYTLIYQSYSFAGNLIPREEEPVEVSPKDLAVPIGSSVTRGQDLRKQTPAVQEALSNLRERINHNTAERERVSAALTAIEASSFSYSWTSDPNPQTDAVRSAGFNIQGALITYQQSVADYDLRAQKAESDIAATKAQIAQGEQCKSDSAPSPALPGTANQSPDSCPVATLPSLRQQLSDQMAAADSARTSQDFSRKSADNQLSSLFSELMSTYAVLIATDTDAEVGYHCPAPTDGVVAVTGDKVTINSTEFSFVYVATERQVRELQGATDLRAEVDSHKISDLRLDMIQFSQENTVDPRSPRYEMVYYLDNLERSFTPLPRESATMVHTSTDIVIPPDFLGTDGETHYVIRGGQRTPVQVSKDTTGQWILLPGSLDVGTVIQEIRQ